MALVSMQQLPETEPTIHKLDDEIEESEGIGELINIPSPAKKTKKKLVRQGSVSENFFAVKGAALILPRHSSIDRSMDTMQIKKFGACAGDLKNHLYAIFNLIRPQDNIKLAARLECWSEQRTRYLVIVTAIGRQDTEESIIVGMDFAARESKECTIGLVIPIWSDTGISLDGDGGFVVTGRERTHTFKPVSVQAMWSALQAIHKCIDNARQHNYYFGSLYLTWTCYYESRINSPRLFVNEWEYREEIYSWRANYFENKDVERESTEQKIRGKLKEVMMKMDLDNCTSRDIRVALEKVIDLDLKQYKTYIDSEMIVMLRQMDTSSKILDYLYLGSEWNASNLEELNEVGITHILNITMEIDNFYPDDYTYKNIRCHDIETTDLLHVWNDTYKFIKRAHRQNGKVLVHCKMGISRSAASVSAYLMKEHLWSMEKALSFVKERRAIVHPNKGFMRQLQEYEGILNASAQRHNRLFRSLSESNLSADHPLQEEEEDGTPPERLTPTHHVVEQVPTFDLNRRLLDLTVLPYRSNHKRPKSWSFGDAKHYCLDVDDILLGDHEKESSLDRSHASEPQGVIAPILSSRSEVGGATYPNEKRKKWKRRHTEHIFCSYAFADNPPSDDSVFANPGVTPMPRIDSWVATVPDAPKRQDRVSSPAALQSVDLLTVNTDDDKIHSSMISPMNSPSFDSTKNVNVPDLKHRFDEDSVPQLESTAKPEVTTQDLSTAIDDAPLSVVVKNVVAEIESPDEAPQEVTQAEPPLAGRERSLSENQAYVKNRVSEIESRYSTQGSASSGSVESFPEKENTEGVPASGVARSQSLPTRRKKPLLSPPLQTLPVIEDKQIDTSPKKCLDKNMNVNNNNYYSDGFQKYDTTTVIEMDEDAEDDGSPVLKTISQLGCTIMEKVPCAAVGHAKTPEASPKKLLKRFPIRTLTQSELQVIREVGKTFLTEPMEQKSASSLESSSCSNVSSPPQSLVDEETPYIKRGIVRRMARMIEGKMKEDQDLGIQPNASTDAPHGVDTSHSTTVINKLLMGESVTSEVDFAVPYEVPEEKLKDPEPDSGQAAPQASERPMSSRKIRASASTSNLNDLISLVAPAPYKPLRMPSAASPGESSSNQPFRYKKMSVKHQKGIRRTQSERSAMHPIKMLFQDVKWKPKGGPDLRQTRTSKSHPELSAKRSNEGFRPKAMVRQNSDGVFSSNGVREIVQSIENSNPPKTACDRPAEMGTWSGGDRYPVGDEVGTGSSLRRSNSNPYIGQNQRKSFPVKCYSKVRTRKKAEDTRFRTLNPFYQTM